MSDNRWPNDSTRFRIEARDLDGYGLYVGTTEGGTWRVVGDSFEYDTFAQATEQAEKQSQVYRDLRIVRVVDTVVAAYKDGVVSE